MDFFDVRKRKAKGGGIELYPEFKVERSRDLMVRGRSFYGVWDAEKGCWSTDEYDVQRIVDRILYLETQKEAAAGTPVSTQYLKDFSNNGWVNYRRFLSHVSDNSHPLDEKLTWADTVTKKTDYASKRLPYSMAEGDYSAWEELISTLYSPEEREKIEWAIGAVISGDSKTIQKFLVLYGHAGTGKSTVLNVIQQLFAGYTASFEAKALVGNNNSFGTEIFRSNPLVAIQHDGDLSKIEDNTKLNSIISHEEMTLNEKYKPSYTGRINAFLFMGTNKPVKISDSKSGIIRRLIDVSPTGKLIPVNHYHTLMTRIEFELGAIADHCLKVYRELGKNYYKSYRPMGMMFQTDVFFNFVEAHFDIFKAQDGVTLKQAYALYKEYCNDAGVEFKLPMYKVREELRSYFDEFLDQATVDGQPVRSYFKGFTHALFKVVVDGKEQVFSLVMDKTYSIFDAEHGEFPAQLANKDGLPKTTWSRVTTTLAEIDTREIHYVKVPLNHIVMDFDLTDDQGNKSLELNLRAASEWPPTYSEISKSGCAVHLHYIYDGDVTQLSPIYSEGIEVKVFKGNSSLRRKLTLCNDAPIATISSGLPLKERKRVLPSNTMKSERGLREAIARNLRKEVHAGTKPSIDYIKKLLDDAYASDMVYDLTDMRSKIVAFANNSTNQAIKCLMIVKAMKFKSEEKNEGSVPPTEDPLVFFDIEVYPNLLVVCWKYRGAKAVVRMINPTPVEVEGLFKMKLVGFNNRRYDNHILWARYLGYDNEQLYKLSKRIIDGDQHAMFAQAYNISYADIYDFSSKKQGLKKFQIDLGILHMELDFPWDEPIAEEHWPKVVEYCCNDVDSTEATFESRIQDFVARQILADLSGLSVNDTTQKHTAKIVFGDDRNPQRSFVYTDLSEMFPGYQYDRGKSTYMDEEVGEGGYVYAEPGMYENVALLDVASMHPTSILRLNAFGEYTQNFGSLIEARLAIKNRQFDKARGLLGGKLEKHLVDTSGAEALAYALKIVINIVYGLTSAKFDNAFRDVRNKDNIVAKRGALFMIDLKIAVQNMGYTVAHIKTDSIKIPDATPEIIQFVKDFGEKYGYTFEHEGTYDQFCLVNDAVYIARQDKPDGVKWTAVGAQFQHPYVHKTLFTGEEITMDDLKEAKSVSQGTMYLDFNAEKPMALADADRMQFIGRTGLFVPVLDGGVGGTLYRVKDGKFYSVTGTKGHLWTEAKAAEALDRDKIDMSYFENLANEARNKIDFFGPFATFVK